jgi:hypothetical protein
MQRYVNPNNWPLVVLGALTGIGLLAVAAAVISAATCWD